MSKQTLKIGLFAAIFLFAAGAARAQAPAPADAMAAARELAATIRLTDQFKAVMPMVVGMLKDAIVKGRPEIERDYEAVMALLSNEMQGQMNTLSDRLAGLYAQHFSADEIRQLTTFCRSPLGQKILDKTPAITQQSIAIGQQFGRSVADQLRSRMIEELRKKGHNI